MNIKRRDFLKLVGSASAVLLVPDCCNALSNNAIVPEKPNIVVILADDLGYGDISAYNPQSKIKTPNVDALAKNGIQFTDAHTNTAQCSPTRYGLLTGRYAWRTRLKKGVLPHYAKPLIEKERVTLASMLKSNGYDTAAIGKWHLGLGWQAKDGQTFDHNSWSGKITHIIDFNKKLTQSPLDNGFDYYFGIGSSNNMLPYCYIENNIVANPPKGIKTENYDTEGRTAPVADDYKSEQIDQVLWKKAKQWLASHFDRNPEKPFFLYYPTSAIHRPCLPVDGFRNSSDAGLRGDKVVELDSIVGKLTAELKKRNCLDNTLIIFTSDNGPRPGDPEGALKHLAKNAYGKQYNPDQLLAKKQQGTYGNYLTYGHKPSAQFTGHKMSVNEGGHRVPFIAHWPKAIKHPKKSSQMLCTTDVLATFAEMLKVDLPVNAGEDSISFLPAIKSAQPKTPLRTTMINDSWRGVKAIRKGDWKLIMADNTGALMPIEKRKVKTPLQLYNLKDDPAEDDNLYEKHPEIVKELSGIFKQQTTSQRSAPAARHLLLR